MTIDNLKKSKIIGFPHTASSIGGPGSFQSRLVNALSSYNYQIVYPEDKQVPDVVLVVGGTAKLSWLLWCKSNGAKIVHRLDGLYWRHYTMPMPVQKSAKLEARNWLMYFIRHYLADHIVYQSQFIRDWWHRKYGKASCAESVVYNAVDLSEFKPSETYRESPPILLCVEGAVQDDPITLKTLSTATEKLVADGSISKTIVCGDVSPEAQNQLMNLNDLSLLGKVPREKMPEFFATNAVFLVLEINPPCPNSVIEALASGVPVVGFDTGALSELVPPEAGIIVPYKGNPWKLEQPNFFLIEEAIKNVLASKDEYNRGARLIAEQRFGLDKMVNLYHQILFDNT